MKYILLLILLASVFILFITSCKKENPMFRVNIGNRNQQTIEELDNVKKEGYINETEYLLLHDQLLADSKACLENKKRLECSEIEDMVKATLLKFDNVKMNEELVGIVMAHYFTITASNQVRYLSLGSVGEYCNIGSIIQEWYESRQTLADKFNDIRLYLKRAEQFEFEIVPTDKLKEVVQRAYADVEKIEQDSTLTDQAIKNMILASLEASKNPEMEMMYTHMVGNIYFRLAKIKNIDDSDITAYFTDSKNNLGSEPLSDQALELSVYKRIDLMLEEGLVEKEEYNLLKKYLVEDVKVFLHGDEDEAKLVERVKSSLKKLKNILLDTEDREFVAETYYDIANRRGLEIGELLNDWLYK